MTANAASRQDALTFEALARVLARVPGAASAAESDGVICGVLCAPGAVDDADWMAEILGEVAPGDQAADDCRRVLRAARDARQPRLVSADMDFMPLLPPDAEPLAVRGEALGQWCEGFLLGVALGGLPDPGALPAPAREVIEDLAAMIRIDADAPAGESAEADFMELVEYVRVGVMMLHDELRGPGTGPAPGAPLH